MLFHPCIAIEDPNNDLVLWESGAIITYIVGTYDTEKRLTYEGLKDRHHVNQWLHFQMSGQGPYFGQLTWYVLAILSSPRAPVLTTHSSFPHPRGRFTWLHHEKLPSAIHRYTAELRRVLGVLDGRLAVAAAAAGGGPGEPAWLVGDKMTLADLAFVPWNAQLDLVLSQTWDQVFAGLPHARAWHGRLAALPSWQRTLAQQERCKKEQNLGTYGQPVDSEVSLAEYAGQHDGPRPA